MHLALDRHFYSLKTKQSPNYAIIFPAYNSTYDIRLYLQYRKVGIVLDDWNYLVRLSSYNAHLQLSHMDRNENQTALSKAATDLFSVLNTPIDVEEMFYGLARGINDFTEWLFSPPTKG